ncbi:ferritin-like domain-containing protein [uncultured Mycolicibacterium sp.]|uniref:ferritin-like domain-containing protein n=1 Tax=uncultured Mycolicibacterium sp. TaxID=2320817 RepID=UPI0034571B69
MSALTDAVAVEHGVIYGYGLVSAHTDPEHNWLVSEALAQHRRHREAAIALLRQRSEPAPLPAAGYDVPFPVDDPTDAARLAVQMEQDTATAWRAVLEQAGDAAERALALDALTDAAVTAARWRTVLGVRPVTVPFPGGTE